MKLLSVIENHRNLRAIVNSLHANGGHCYLVGGCVRDHLLDLRSQNFDLEVFGLPSEKIIEILKPIHEIDMVGKSYGILKIRGLDIDIGIPRQEHKIGQLHTDFAIQENPFLPLEQAIKRRDFTINSIYFDIKNQQIIDPFHGIEDLQRKILRHTSERFSEDPLRVLRGMQFCARFQLTPAPETVELCKTLSPHLLSPERIYQEFVKLLIQGTQPSLGLNFLQQTHWLEFFPEIHRLIGVEQDPLRHPEGDVFIHTCCALDAFANNRTGNFSDDLTLGFALLCHDFGKPATTVKDSKGVHSYWHEIAGILPAKNFMERLRVPRHIILQALTLVQYHMEPRRLFKRKASNGELRRLSYNVRRLDLLIRMGYCDCWGRVKHNDEIHAWTTDRAKALGIFNAPPKAIIQGRHLTKLGMSPSKDFSKILLKTYFAQLNGDFSTVEDGLLYVRRLIPEEKDLAPTQLNLPQLNLPQRVKDRLPLGI
ncbi:MAG: polynucleotide adenylyltransferase [Puniceicoccales bacterium]|jgi:tRNA nucleotidyltransferase (CCA-adding enzyme)|nr:polynucleotide adenylyltransferase [Puniceicoccales bacterium]